MTSGNEVTKRQPQALDNFGDFDDSIEGTDDLPTSGRLIGTRLKFTNDAKWVTHPNGGDCTNRVLLATNIRRKEIKWGPKPNAPPVDSRELKSGEKFRNMDVLNATCPKSEWRDKFGKFVGPWEIQHVLEFADLESMERFSWPTSTDGGNICVHELVDRINMKREFYKRVDIWPLVKLSHCFMPTKFGGRERPDLKIKDWFWPNKDKDDKIETAQPQPKSLPPALQQVPELTLEEALQDKLPY
jgi:hypothetical protein